MYHVQKFVNAMMYCVKVYNKKLGKTSTCDESVERDDADKIKTRLG